MEKKIDEIKKELSVIKDKPITRKEAIKKTGLIAASAATMMLLLGTPQNAAASPAPPPCDSNRPRPRPGGGGHHRGPWH